VLDVVLVDLPTTVVLELTKPEFLVLDLVPLTAKLALIVPKHVVVETI